ncbi:MAG: phage tail protein [Rhodovulum sp.]
MPSDGVSLITDIGEAKLTEALGSGVAVQIAEVAMGDGGGAVYDPGAGQTRLKRELARQAITRQHLIDTNSWRITAEFDSDTPPFWVREIGFFDTDGDLIAIWAGADIAARKTGAIDYVLDHVLNLSRVKEGLVIVSAPDDGLFDLAVSTGTALANLQLEQLRHADILRRLT